MKPSDHKAKRRGAGAMRLRGLVRKEFLQVLRDPSSIAIAFAMPVVLLILFGYGVSLDAKNVPVAIVIEQPSSETASLMAEFQGNEYFDPVQVASMPDAERELAECHAALATFGDRGHWLRELAELIVHRKN